MRGIVNLASISGLGIGGRGAVVAGFSPDDIAGLRLWLDASDTSTLTLTGSSVDAWTDKVAGYIFAQSSSSAKPTSGATVNGKNAITFDGIDDYLNLINNTILVGQTGIVFAVVKTPAVIPGSTGATMSVASDDSSTAGFVAPTGFQIVTGTPYNRVAQRVSGGAGQNTVRAAEAASADTTYVLAVASDGSAFTLRSNGAVQTNVGTGAGGWFADTTNPANTTIGAILRNGGLANLMWGDVCEILGYDAVNLSAGDVDLVEEYLAAKWGVTLA